ncbi:MAG: PrgI family protein [Clostridia bacterium]|nr:PrgI family protein [Clostridia bacterium]
MRRLQTKFVADISRYTQNFALGMSPRQTAAAIAGGTLMSAGPLLWPAGDVLCFAAGFLVIMAGFLRPDGLPLERYLWAWLKAHLLRPSRRHYEPDGIPIAYLWEGKVGGRVCFRPAQYLKKEEKSMLDNTASEMQSPPPSPAEMPAETEAAKEEAAASPEPSKKAPAKTASRKPKKSTKGQTRARGRVVVPEPPPDDAWLKPRVRSRVPRYGTGPGAPASGARKGGIR